MYLVDTNVISAAAPTKSQAVPALIGWMEENAPRLYLSVITIAEVEDGDRQGTAPRRDPEGRPARRLARDAAPPLRCSRSASGRRGGSAPRCAVRSGEGSWSRAWLADLAIAATAASRGFMVLTRNVRHFRALSVPATIRSKACRLDPREQRSTSQTICSQGARSNEMTNHAGQSRPRRHSAPV